MNTEIRSQLFMHSFGYLQSILDFGNVRRYLEQAEQRRVNYLSVMGSDEPVSTAKIANPSQIDKFKGTTNQIYRQFYMIRLRQMLGIDRGSIHHDALENADMDPKILQ